MYGMNRIYIEQHVSPTLWLNQPSSYELVVFVYGA